MADTLTNIQTDIRFWADDDNLTVTSGANLRAFNTVYEGMLTPDYRLMGVKIGRRWPEVTREDTSLTMVIGQEQYTWPASPDFKPPFYIEGLDTNASNDPYPIPPAPDMASWSVLDDQNNARPIYYRLIDVSGTVKLALRPAPDQADPIRITGLIEVTALTGGSDSTIFLNQNADKALAMLVAATFKAKRGDPSRALDLIQMARGMLPLHDSAPMLDTGGYILPWCV